MGSPFTPLLLFSLSAHVESSGWIPERDVAHAHQLKSEAAGRVQALQLAFPGLTAGELTRSDLDALADDESDDDAPIANVLHRAERYSVLRGAWVGGLLILRLQDTLLGACRT